MLNLYDKVSAKCSRVVTQTYSTSFSLGILCFDQKLREPIYAIYGFVRMADEIVDTFHEFNKPMLLEKFRRETYAALQNKISLNPILHNFQITANKYDIDVSLIDHFLKSMEMDLTLRSYTPEDLREYIYGSAEVVGLMCLKVFCSFGEADYEKLKPYAMRLGSAFQKVNFLRDMSNDYEILGRVYFPDLNLQNFSCDMKDSIEESIEEDFKEAYIGIKLLPPSARLGVYVAYIYYRQLFLKIRKTAPEQVMQARIRIPNDEKFRMLFTCYLKNYFNLIEWNR